MADDTPGSNTVCGTQHQIDAVDRELLALLNRRAAIASHVGELKKKEGSVVFRPEREAQVIDGLKAANTGPLKSASVAPSMTSSAKGDPRCGAPSGVPVTTTRSSTLARRDTAVVALADTGVIVGRDGASTTCVLPTTMARKVVPPSNVSSTAPTGTRRSPTPKKARTRSGGASDTPTSGQPKTSE